MPLVVGGVLPPVVRVQFFQPGHRLVERRARRQIQHERPHLGAQEVVRARRPERGQPGMPGPRQEVQHGVGVVEVSHLRPVLRGDRPHVRRESSGPLPPLALRQSFVPLDDRPERLGPAPLGEEPLGGADDVQRVPLALLGGVTPGGDPVPPSTHPMACGLAALTAAMSSPSWNPGRRHGTHTTVSPKHSKVSFSPSAAHASAMPESGCRWSTWAASTSPCIAVSMEGAAPPCRGGSSRTRRPSRPRAPPPDTRRRAPAAGPAATRPARPRSASRDHPRTP